MWWNRYTMKREWKGFTLVFNIDDNVGLNYKLCQSVLNSAVMLATYEKIFRFYMEKYSGWIEKEL